MNNFKSFLASAALAVSTLGFVAVSAPAQACTNCGLKLNGVETNGLKLNGPTFNGFKINGLSLNGPFFNGIKWNGPILQGTESGTAQSGRFLAITLPSGETVTLR